MLRAYLSLIVVASVSAVVAEPPAALNGRVASIRFEPEQQPLTPEQISSHLPLKVNDTLTTAGVRKTIQDLYSTGRYETIEVAGLRQPDGIALIIRTRERLFVGGVDVKQEVKTPPSRGQLLTATALSLGRPFSDIDLENATRNISDLLKRNGYYEEVKIEPRVTTDPEYEQANIVFTVSTGKRAELTEPQIEGQPVLEPDKVIGATKWHNWLLGWRPATQERILSGVQRVRRRYAKDNRLLAEVRVNGMDYDPATRRLKPRLYVAGGPKVDITTVGAKVSKGNLRKYIPVYDEGAVDRDLIVEGERNLRDYFQSKGYFDVEIDFEERTKSPDHQEIVYIITRGPRQKLAAVEVTGNRYFDTYTIRERMFLRPGGFLRLRHGRYSDGFVRRDENAIKALYNANGFRDVKVRIQRVDDHRGKDGEIAAVVHITEGPQSMVSSFNVTGIRQIDPNQVLSHLASVEGQPLSESNIAMDRDFILREYQTAGFPDATFDWSMKPGPSEHEYQVEYRISEGKRRWIRDVVVTGNAVTSPRLLDRILSIKPGQPLSITRLGQVQRDMYQLGIFDQVNMAVQNPDGDTDHKYVLYRLDEGHRWYVGAGAGAEIAKIGGGGQNDYTNPGGATGFSPRASFDVSRLNLWGLGHSLNLKTRFSSLRRRALLDYSAPRYRNVEGRNLSVTGLYDDTRDVRTFTAKRWEVSTQFSNTLTKATTALLRFSYRRVSVDPGSLKIAPELIPQLAVPVRVGMLSGNLVQDRRDDPMDSHRGFYNTLDVGLASNVFGSQRSFGRVLARNASYHAFGNSEIVLARNLQIGWLAPFRYSGLTASEAVPLPERFFGGGSTSHRGFPDNQSGPRDFATGFPVGGNALFFHQTELRFPFIGDNINGVLFHDMGNVFSTMGDLSFRVRQRDLRDFNYMVHAGGFGIRYRTPVGPIRVDLAYSINPPQFFGFKGTREELLFGQGTQTVQRVSRFQFFFSIGQTF